MLTEKMWPPGHHLFRVASGTSYMSALMITSQALPFIRAAYITLDISEISPLYNILLLLA